MSNSLSDPAARARFLIERLPQGGLFDGKSWRVSPDPFYLSPSEGELLVRLGPTLAAFQDAAAELYLESMSGDAPAWVAERVNRGKPAWLVNLGREAMSRGERPMVIRPDLVWTEDGPRLTELDSVPGGLGLLTWLLLVYRQAGVEALGGAEILARAFGSLFEKGVIVSEESADYLPEMKWLVDRLGEWFGETRVVKRPWELEAGDYSGSWYRFFELFDLAEVQQSERMREAMEAGAMTFTPPWTPAHEEKLWLALYHVPQLRDAWKRKLSEADIELLDQVIPRGWIVEDGEGPPGAVIAGLGVPSWREVRDFSQKQRRMALKISGFSTDGWGARSVVIGHDVPGPEWAAAIDNALADQTHVWIAQEFHVARVRPQRWWNGAAMLEMNGRARICPYFIRRPGIGNSGVEFGGALATVCPEDKKILHGMTDAVMTPVAVR